VLAGKNKRERCQVRLAMNIKTITWILGALFTLFGIAMLTTGLVSLFYHTAHFPHFLFSGLCVIATGMLCKWISAPRPTGINRREGCLIVVLSWFCLSVIGAVPFLVTGTCHSFINAFFEAASGLTTTGATILNHLDQQPPSILFWRSMLQWFGGMGIIVFAIAIMPFLGIGGMQMFKAEVPGPVKDKLTARISQTGKALWMIYFGLTLACAAAYWADGMTLFDAFNHAMCTLSTGGFSTHDASFGFYNKASLNWIATLFMFLGGINFALHYTALHGGLHRAYIADDEFRAYAFWLIILIATSYLVGVTSGIRWDQMIFTIVSIATSTGFVNTDYSFWPPAALLLLAAAMFVGASAGSTAGGLKIIRMMLLNRQGIMELKRFLHPTAILHIKVNHRTVASPVIRSLWAFAVLYITGIFVLSILVAMTGVDILTAISASLTCISNTGPGFGPIVGPASNYLPLPGAAKVLLVIGMIAGRLEIFTLLLVLTPFFWRK